MCQSILSQVESHVWGSLGQRSLGQYLLGNTRACIRMGTVIDSREF